MDLLSRIAGWLSEHEVTISTVMALVFAAGSAAADPLIAGCCDSMSSEPSYLDLVWDDYGWPLGGDPYDHNLGVDASSSTGGLSRLQTYLAAEDPDAVIVLSGTPDTFCELGGWCPAGYPGGDPPRDYSPVVTFSNIAGMVDAVLTDSGFSEPVLVAPPPVLEGCLGSGGLSCAEIDGRLAALSVVLGDLAVQENVAFVNLYEIIAAHPDPGTLYKSDGVHPNHTEGDPLIRDLLLPKLAEIFCGNGILDPGEACDDGNNVSGDGCPADCGVGADCQDGLDNDGDGSVDFGEDFGCDSPYDPSERTTPGAIACDDGVDNEATPDGLIDFPDDPGCAHPLQMTESPECQDGVDNDSDGKIDFDGGASAGIPEWWQTEPDPQCTYGWQFRESLPTPSPTPMATPTPRPTPTPTPVQPAICADGFDNDGDGLTDHPADPGCASISDSTETDPSLICDDGLDNDSDGLIDFPADPGCEDLLDDTESPEPMEADVKLKCRLKFNKPSRDKLQVLIENWQLPQGVMPTEVTVDVGGASFTGTLDVKGKYKSADGRDSIKVKQKNGLWKITVKRKNNDFAADLADEGLTDADNPKPGVPVTVPLAIEVGGVAYGRDVDLVYKSKQGKKGTAK